MHITGTHINYYLVCHRKLWLFSNSIQMEHTSQLVDEGRLIHETSYPRRQSRYQEFEMDGIKVDFYDPREKIIHEIKKSNKIEEAHEWQVKYYIQVMERNGITGVTGIIEYPKLRKTKEVILSDKDRKEIFYFLEEIPKITENETSPSKINSKICKNCSYHDFCYCGEV